MASARQKWKLSQEVEKELLALIQGSKPTYEQIDYLIHQMRTNCEQTMFLDFEFAAKECVGKHLWDAHIMINNRYRKILARYRSEKKASVERRKVEQHYVDFIKTSQFFYKGYIQRLASHFSGIKGLVRVAGSLSLEYLSANPPAKVSPEIRRLIEQSCHATLLRLGDLSRYRNQLRKKQRSWEPAMGYYQLANDLDPVSGMAHNKMAVIALADDNHLNVVYHLYRATAAPESDPLASGNLEIEFKKILTASFTVKNDPLATLIWWFVLLHAKFHSGIEFSTHEELQNEVLSRLVSCLKEESCGEILEKFVIISIAAQYFAGQRLQDQSSQPLTEAINFFTYTVAFNVRMMSQLLSVLLPELDDHSAGENLPLTMDTKPAAAYKKITAVARQILPSLRHYTLWLASNPSFVGPNIGNSTSRMHNKQLWNKYAVVLTRIVNHFPVAELPRVPYLLEEDASTVGFKPFRGPELVDALDVYTNPDGQLKSYIGEPGVKRSHPNVEMQSRIVDIVCCAIQLQISDQIPLHLSNKSGRAFFTFVGDGLQPGSPSTHSQEAVPLQQTHSSCDSQFPIVERVEYKTADDVLVSDPSAAAHDFHDSKDRDMERMVDQLVEPCYPGKSSASCETSYGMHSNTAHEVFINGVLNGSENRLQSTPKMLPSISSLYNSAFTPQPNELQPHSPNRPSTGRHLSPSSISTRDERLTVAAALDKLTGYSPTSLSWGRKSSRPLSTTAAQVITPQNSGSMAQPLMPISSQFGDDSSVYMNTSSIGKNLIYANDHSGGDDSTFYPGPSHFDSQTMFQSFIYDGSQPANLGSSSQTPPGGQCG